jgi:hypothetical protein
MSALWNFIWAQNLSPILLEIAQVWNMDSCTPSRSAVRANREKHFADLAPGFWSAKNKQTNKQIQ